MDLFVKTADAPVATVNNVKPFTVERLDVATVAAALAARKAAKKVDGAGRPASKWVAVLKETPLNSGFVVGKANNPQIDREIINLRNNLKAMVARKEMPVSHIVTEWVRRPILDENGNEIPVLDKDGNRQTDANGNLIVQRVGPDEEVVRAYLIEGEGIKRPRKAKEGQESAPAPATA